MALGPFAKSLQVFQAVRKLIDEQLLYQGRATPVSVSSVYDGIKRSNSSLNRKSKRLLEGSIERVVAVINEHDPDATEDRNGSATEGEQAARDEVATEV